MPKETMTPRERWLAVLSRQKPDRVPMDYWGTEEFAAKLKAYMGCDDMREIFQRLHIDRPIRRGAAGDVGPALPPHTDVLGCRYRDVDYGTGSYDECVYNPLAQYASVEEIEAHYTWPNPDWWITAPSRSR